MYTVVPFRARREVGNPLRTGSLFDDRFFRSFFDMNDWVGNAGFRVDVKEKEDAYVLEAELPGVSEDKINLTVDNDALVIAFDRDEEKTEDGSRYYYSERRTGHFERRFNLEGVQQDNVSADYRNGVLTVTLPKEQPEPEKTTRRIAIGSGKQN